MRHNHLLAPLGDSLAAIPPQKMDSPESINVIFDALALHADALRELIAISCGQSMDWVDALPPDEGEALVLTWWEVNSGFFRSTALASAPPGNGTGRAALWSRVFADLIRAGHHRDALNNYTRRQLILFWEEAQAAERREQARDINAVMYGMVGGTDATALLRQLES
ncbi:DUF6631 family protein [Pseudomonas aeruginosa]|uniref:DUF6631 family protein n=1 Tax=Pseudomonas aeruginosa TaxID=287 RepID=UPI003D7985C9